MSDDDDGDGDDDDDDDDATVAAAAAAVDSLHGAFLGLPGATEATGRQAVPEILEGRAS